MDQLEIYNQLEAAALSYADIKDVPVNPKNELLVAIPANPNLTVLQIGEDMWPITGDQIYVRQTVAQKLGEASLALAEADTDLALQVVYGYRALSIQQRLFDGFVERLQDQYTGEALLEAVHRLIAVPTVAGHPTGGAVDIQIVQNSQNDQPLNFGTRIWEFVPNSFTFSPFVSAEATKNRLLLRSIMMTTGLAPFDGEWWHFSYGDKEWAKYCGQLAAVYEQVEFRP